MKKGVKTIIAGVIIAVCGVVIVLCALGASGWTFSQTVDWEVETVTFDSPVSKLKMEVDAGHAVITRGTNGVVITYDYNDRYQPEIKMSDDGTLDIVTGKKRWYTFGWWYGNAPSIHIEIPQDCQPEMDLTLNAGAVEVEDGNWGACVSVKINAGTMDVGSVVTETLELKINAGKFDADKIACEKFTCRLNAGAFDVEEIVCSEFDCKLNAGSAGVKRLDSIVTSLRLAAGSVDLKLAGAESDYNVSVDKSAGSCNVSGRANATATRNLDIEISAGSVNIKFVG